MHNCPLEHRSLHKHWNKRHQYWCLDSGEALRVLWLLFRLFTPSDPALVVWSSPLEKIVCLLLPSEEAKQRHEMVFVLQIEPIRY